VAREAAAWTRFVEPPPYSILLADRLREEMQLEQLKSSGAEAVLSTIDQLIAENRLSLTQAEAKIRQLNEQLESPSEAAAQRLSLQRELERLRSQVAAGSIGVLDLERQLRQVAVADSGIRLEWLKRQLAFTDGQSKFTQADLDQVNARIDLDRQQLEREFTEAEARADSALRALETARDEQRRSQSLPQADPVAAAYPSEKVATRQAQFDTTQVTTRVLRFMLESVSIERTTWEMRFAAYDSHSVETLSESEQRLNTYNRRLDLWRDFQQQQSAVVPSQIEFEESRLATLGADSILLPLARERLATVRERDQLLLRLVRRMEQLQRLNQRWEDEINVAEARLPLSGRVRNLFSGAGSFIQKLWTLELLTVEDTITVEGQTITGKRSITLGKIILAVLILVIGVWITGLIARVAQPIMIRRFKMDVNQANLIRRWIRALMVACLVIFSLVSVKIPLTVFAFAGGALAIGLGFGTQNLLKNFVSGLIILFERPFRVGDVLDVAGQRGTVTGVGLRASVLQLWDGKETLIPNSALLENNLINWTYTDRKVRFNINVGVAYGSDPRRVTQLLAEAADRHGLVAKDPKPQVLFSEFGDSALAFELRFWVDVTNTNAAQVASDLRLMIAGALAEQKIDIAFPQRDLHLHASGPIPVLVVPSPSAVAPDRITDPKEIAQTRGNGTSS
jgi:small-conductance mechanosensitive channel